MTVSSDNMLQKLSAIQALPVSIAVLDSRGTIVGVNGGWKQFGRHNGLRLPRAGVGLNYLDYCNAPGSSRMLRDLRALLRGRLDLLTLIYPCHSPAKRRWFVLSGVPLSPGAPAGVALVHTDLTGILPDAVTSGEGSSKRSRDEVVRDLDVIGASVERAISEGLASQLTDMLTDRGTVAPSQTAKANTGPTAGLSGLSRRRLEVLRLLGEGKTNKEIAKSLGRSPNTIKLHVSAILRQLRFKNRTEAAVLASELFAAERRAAGDSQTVI